MNCSRCNLRNDIAMLRALETRKFLPASPAMPHLTSLLGFALVSLGIALTPGPNMIYLISRSITQGHIAGLVSLGGVGLGFVFYMLCAAFGITACCSRFLTPMTRCGSRVRPISCGWRGRP